ncbi:MAG: ABC transporter permease, partial [Rickettsiales bacterium]|nr:ABC transporter permease [Rickettsiales bacterium]
MHYFEFLVAWRYLKSKRKDGFISIITWLSLIGIMLGVAVLIIVMSVMNGFREEMLSKILGMNGHVTVLPKHGRDDIADYGAIAKKIAADSAVSPELSMPPIPMIEAQVMVSGDNASQGAMLRAMTFSDMKRIRPLADGIMEEGTNPFKPEEVLAGYQLSGKLGIYI